MSLPNMEETAFEPLITFWRHAPINSWSSRNRISPSYLFARPGLGRENLVPRRLIGFALLRKCNRTRPVPPSTLAATRSKQSDPHLGQNSREDEEPQVLLLFEYNIWKQARHRETHCFTRRTVVLPSILSSFIPICNIIFCMAKSVVAQAYRHPIGGSLAPSALPPMSLDFSGLVVRWDVGRSRPDALREGKFSSLIQPSPLPTSSTSSSCPSYPIIRLRMVMGFASWEVDFTYSEEWWSISLFISVPPFSCLVWRCCFPSFPVAASLAVIIFLFQLH